MSTDMALEAELGQRAFIFFRVENSDWAYKCWWMTGQYQWDAATRSFIKETRPEMSLWAELDELMKDIGS